MNQDKQSETEALLRILELGQKQIEAGEFTPADEFFRQLDLEEEKDGKQGEQSRQLQTKL
ncbi:hypothetical protein [Burkholderia vietnamiensis]|uniref:hypothetical protein n=2 Tax=Burkholderia cepacia complex TaxID=87882 RepID=UPI001CF38218|nr:hypothetical protein [Burkholderia vietnamiensis]MCA7983703.1 hypothetical protein [Burkholderia vietnamiensis]